jgi:hypothetical protein
MTKLAFKRGSNTIESMLYLSSGVWLQFQTRINDILLMYRSTLQIRKAHLYRLY